MSTVYTLNGKVLKNAATDKWLTKKVFDPYNPLNLPPNTIRVRTSDGNAPVKTSATYTSATLVTGTTDVYDVYKSGTSFNSLLKYSSNVVEVLGANTTGISDMSEMFGHCDYLTTVQLFNTSSVTTMYAMFASCASLTSVPLFDTSSVTNMDMMFFYCYKIETGALALYQQASTQTNPPSSHSDTFTDCGAATTTGAAELAQIPSSWGGTGA